jgi:lipopolysaccharide export system protein LptA
MRASRMLRTVAAALLAAGAPAALAAQQQPGPPVGTCQFQFNAVDLDNPPRTNFVQQPSGQYNSFLGGRFRGVCPAQDITILADSLEYYGDTKIMFLIGNVHYEEPRITLDAQRVTYWQVEEHLKAEQNVDARLPSGTSLRGPVVDYYRPAQGIRTQAHMVAPGRPTIRIVERDSTGQAGEPVTVLANTVVMDADSLVYASGRVELTRPDVIARGDSAFVDNGRQFARLMRKPEVHGTGQRPFTLYGQVIDIFGRQRSLDRAISMGEARAVSQDVTLTADTLDFRLAAGQLDRAYAWGASRAHAVSSSYDIIADSMDVRMPGQRIEQVWAVRGAYAESEPDSTKFRSEERDWIRGDTIVATFDTTAAARADTSRRAHIRELLARGSASSFYQLPPQDTATRLPAINYVRGREITIAFESQEVRSVTVTEKAAGVYVEPGTAQASAPGDRPGAPATPASPAPDAQRPPATPPPATKLPARRP